MMNEEKAEPDGLAALRPLATHLGYRPRVSTQGMINDDKAEPRRLEALRVSALGVR